MCWRTRVPGHLPLCRNSGMDRLTGSRLSGVGSNESGTDPRWEVVGKAVNRRAFGQPGVSVWSRRRLAARADCAPVRVADSFCKRGRPLLSLSWLDGFFDALGFARVNRRIAIRTGVGLRSVLLARTAPMRVVWSIQEWHLRGRADSCGSCGGNSCT